MNDFLVTLLVVKKIEDLQDIICSCAWRDIIVSLNVQVFTNAKKLRLL